ncbi:MAG: crossover junction endodeoxyribonuclease RuvC [Candidatus Zambryskibacteria bacterium]|nr:crossover junction endodeoxyribonuclease RuvC [Candidatus Zambryskibacteria bacterium]
MSAKILAIDPGFDRLGMAVLGSEKDKATLLFSDCIVTKKGDVHSERLLAIGSRVREIIEEWKPVSLAIETLFFNQNTTSALAVAEARGVVLYEASRAGLSVYEYSPQAIKIAVTGYGKADKLQVENMVRKLIKIPIQKTKMLDDELDAIAVGITYLATQMGI